MVRFLAVLPLALLLSSCARPVAPKPPVVDELGCLVPDPSTFIKLGVTLDVAQATIGKNSAAGVSVDMTPDVVSLVSQASRDATARTYLHCRALNGFSKEVGEW